MNMEMASTQGFYSENELYGSPVVRNCRMPTPYKSNMADK